MLYTVLLFIRTPFCILLVFLATCFVFWLFWLCCQYLPSDWLERPLGRKPNRGEGIVSRKPRPKSAWCSYFIVLLLYRWSVSTVISTEKLSGECYVTNVLNYICRCSSLTSYFAYVHIVLQLSHGCLIEMSPRCSFSGINVVKIIAVSRANCLNLLSTQPRQPA